MRTMRAFFDLLLPERSDAAVVRSLTYDELNRLRELRQHEAVTALLPFRDEHVRACIHEVKYHQNQRAIELLGGILASYIESQPTTHNTCIIPVPLSTERLHARGFDQVALVAEYAAKKARVKCYSNILTRTRDTKAQTTLTRADRFKNVSGVFALSDEVHALSLLRGTHVIVLDDVTTTGATLRAARAPLAPLTPHLASLSCLALSH